MKDPARILVRHDTLLLLFCSALFGLAWGLGHEHGLIPNPWWYTPSLQRLCLILMGWTALLHSDPLQRLFWSVTDFVAVTLPYFAGQVFVPQMELPALIDYWVVLGKVSATGAFGIAVTQSVYSLLRAGVLAGTGVVPIQRKPRPTPDAEVKPALGQSALLTAVNFPQISIQEPQPTDTFYIDEPLSEIASEQALDQLEDLGENVRRAWSSSGSAPKNQRI